MPTDNYDPTAVENRLWSEIERHQIGMLGVAGGEPNHFQPMTAFLDRATRQLWFFTHTDSDLAREIGDGAAGVFILQQRELQACLDGRLVLTHERDRIEQYWNAVVAAWYPEGKADPRLAMIRLDCQAAGVWLSLAGPIRFAWEIAKANATHRPPEVGLHQNLTFN
jgi:general stress protein 26